jgi:hypothetical protein
MYDILILNIGEAGHFGKDVTNPAWFRQSVICWRFTGI